MNIFSTHTHYLKLLKRHYLLSYMNRTNESTVYVIAARRAGFLPLFPESPRPLLVGEIAFRLVGEFELLLDGDSPPLSSPRNAGIILLIPFRGIYANRHLHLHFLTKKETPKIRIDTLRYFVHVLKNSVNVSTKQTNM
jgi:hypothetical protein